MSTQIRTPTLQKLTLWIDSFGNCQADDGTVASENTRNNAKAIVERFYEIFPEGKEPQIGRSSNGGIAFTFHMDHDQILGEVIEENCELEDNQTTQSFKLPDDIDAIILFIKGEAVVTSNNNIPTEKAPEESKSENLPTTSAEEPQSNTETTAKKLEKDYEEVWTQQNLFEDPVWAKRPTNRVKIVLPSADPLPVMFVFAGPPEECIWSSNVEPWHPLKKQNGNWCTSYSNLQKVASEVDADLNQIYMIDAWPYKVWRSDTKVSAEDVTRGDAWIHAVATSLELRIVVLLHGSLSKCMVQFSTAYCGLENSFVWLTTRHPSPQSMVRPHQRLDLRNALERVINVKDEEDLEKILEEFQPYRFTGRAPENVLDLFNDSDEQLKTGELYERALERTPGLVYDQIRSSPSTIKKETFRAYLKNKAGEYVTLENRHWSLTHEGKKMKNGGEEVNIEDALANLKM